MFSLPNDTNLNNFHCELFALQSLVGRCLLYVTVSHAVHTVQSSALWRMKMKEPHCGLFSGKVTNVATPCNFCVSCQRQDNKHQIIHDGLQRLNQRCKNISIQYTHILLINVVQTCQHVGTESACCGRVSTKTITTTRNVTTAIDTTRQ